MGVDDTSGLSLQGELLACLGQAMQPPRSDAFFNALRDWLVDDIADLCGALGAESVAADLPPLRCALGEVEDRESLLLAYSVLFLAPPPKVRLNLVRLMDGASSGAGLGYLDEMLARHQLNLRSEHRELPDHLTVVLELAACLISRGEQGNDQAERDAKALLQQMVAPAARHLAETAADVERAHGLPKVYSRLLALIGTTGQDPDGCLLPGTRSVAGEATGASKSAPDTGPAMAACARCGTPFVSLCDQAVLIAHLQEAGAPADHLHVCPDCRTGPGG